MAEVESVKKLSIKAIGGDGKEAIRKNAAVLMGSIYGEAQSAVTKEARNGDPYSFLVGVFRGISADGKKVFESDCLYLPGFLYEKIAGELKAGNQAVQFAYQIIAQPSTKATIGYEYSYKSLIQTKAHDRLAQMEAAMKSSAPSQQTSQPKAK